MFCSVRSAKVSGAHHRKVEQHLDKIGLKLTLRISSFDLVVAVLFQSLFVILLSVSNSGA